MLKGIFEQLCMEINGCLESDSVDVNILVIKILL